MFLSPGVHLCVEGGPEKHASHPRNRVSRTIPQGGDACPRAIPKDRHPGPEDESPKGIGNQMGRLHVQPVNQTKLEHAIDACAADHYCGEHHLQDREVLEEKLSDDDVEPGEAALSEQEAEDEPRQCSQQKSCGIREEAGIKHGCAFPCHTWRTRSRFLMHT